MAAFFRNLVVVATGREGERSGVSTLTRKRCEMSTGGASGALQIRSRKSLDLCQKPTAQQLFLWQCARLIVAIAVWHCMTVWWLPLVLGMCLEAIGCLCRDTTRLVHAPPPWMAILQAVGLPRRWLYTYIHTCIRKIKWYCIYYKTIIYVYIYIYGCIMMYVYNCKPI